MTLIVEIAWGQAILGGADDHVPIFEGNLI